MMRRRLFVHSLHSFMLLLGFCTFISNYLHAGLLLLGLLTNVLWHRGELQRCPDTDTVYSWAAGQGRWARWPLVCLSPCLLSPMSRHRNISLPNSHLGNFRTSLNRGGDSELGRDFKWMDKNVDAFVTVFLQRCFDSVKPFFFFSAELPTSVFLFALKVIRFHEN